MNILSFALRVTFVVIVPYSLNDTKIMIVGSKPTIELVIMFSFELMEDKSLTSYRGTVFLKYKTSLATYFTTVHKKRVKKSLAINIVER